MIWQVYWQKKMFGNYNASFSRQHTVKKPFCELFGIFVHT